MREIAWFQVSSCHGCTCTICQRSGRVLSARPWALTEESRLGALGSQRRIYHWQCRSSTAEKAISAQNVVQDAYPTTHLILFEDQAPFLLIHPCAQYIVLRLNSIIEVSEPELPSPSAQTIKPSGCTHQDMRVLYAEQSVPVLREELLVCGQYPLPGGSRECQAL